MAKKIVIAALIIVVVGATYLWLGGGQTLEFQVKEKSSFYIVGSDYKGPYNGSELERIFFDTRQKSETSQSDLVVLNYDNDSLREGQVHQLVGIEHASLPTNTDGSDVVEMKSGKYLFTTINAHNLVMPKPESVRSQAVKFAADLGLKPDENISIEIYHGRRSLEILFPLTPL